MVEGHDGMVFVGLSSLNPGYDSRAAGGRDGVQALSSATKGARSGPLVEITAPLQFVWRDVHYPGHVQAQ